MRLHVILAFYLTLMAVMFLVAFVLRAQVRETEIERTEQEVRTYAGTVLNQIGAIGGLQSALTDTMITELHQAALIYEGRILVVDSSLNVLVDTYDMEIGKTLISEEAILSVRGESSTYRSFKERYMELSLPITESVSGTVIGVFLIRISLTDIALLQNTLDRTIGLLLSFIGVVLFVFILIYSRHLTKPLKKISSTIAQVTEGTMEEKVSIHGYYEIEQISDSFNIMLEQLNKIEESRQEFVANVSHELKTPMTSIKVLADSLLMQESVPEPLYREFLTDINEEIERENKIITDLLSLVKLDQKAGVMHIAQVSINDLLEIILKRLKPIAKKQNIEMIYESFRNVLAEVDEVKLSLALSNLIENAVKYNVPGGWVKVSLNSDHKYFYLRVADSGIGIPEEEQAHIFERFYRVDKTRARTTGGTGLGLAITREVVLMHKGTIKLFSRENEGAMFTLRIPLSFIAG